MIFRFIMLSDEVDDFRREFRIDADASFLDLHNVIVKSVGYKTGEMASFFICGDDWSKETEITFVEMDTRSEVDSNIMADCTLGDFLEDEKQKLMYVFDYMSDRAFFMELREIVFGEDLDKAEVSKTVGKAPEQILQIEEEIITKAVPAVAAASIIDDEFYGDEGYNEDELDADGFEGIDNDTNIEDDISIEDLEI